ncbi:MAG: condensation domain-containing protein, partial [Bacillota bacterium]
MKHTVYYPLSHPQLRIWYTEMLFPGTAFANNCGSVKIKRDFVNLGLLNKAINLTIQHNDALRIRLIQRAGEAQLYVAEYQELNLDLIQGPDVDERFQMQSRTPFVLMDAPLAYFALVKYPDESYGYYIKLHHLISDGFSLSILNQQIVEYYDCLEKGENTEELSRPAFTDYLQRETEYLASQQCSRDRQYWLGRLENIPEPLNMHFSTTKTGITSTRRIFRFAEGLRLQIDQFCRLHEITLFRFMLSVFYLYLARAYGNSDLILGTAHANRMIRKELKTIGMYVSTLPVRISFDLRNTFIELLNHINSQLAADMAHQQYPYDLLVRDLQNLGRDPNGMRNINVVQIPNAKNKKIIAQDWFQGADPAILNMVINPRQLPKGAALEIALDYRDNLFQATEIERLFQCLLTLIQDVLDHPKQSCGRLAIISKDEERKILTEFQGRVLDYDRQATFIDLFKARATQHPDKTAIVDCESSLTYGQTDVLTDRLARELVRLGVTADTFVGIMLPRRKEFMVAVIGAMKAGGAYVPLDNEYPRERIAYMLEDSRAKVLITAKSLYEQKGLCV